MEGYIFSKKQIKSCFKELLNMTLTPHHSSHRFVSV